MKEFFIWPEEWEQDHDSKEPDFGIIFIRRSLDDKANKLLCLCSVFLIYLIQCYSPELLYILDENKTRKLKQQNTMKYISNTKILEYDYFQLVFSTLNLTASSLSIILVGIFLKIGRNKYKKKSNAWIWDCTFCWQ